MANQKTILDCLILLAEAFRHTITEVGEDGKPRPAPLCAIYVEHLRDLDDEQIKRATSRAISELKWFPKVAELRALAGVRGQVEPSPADRALVAWSFVTHAVERHGGWNTVVFDDPIIHAVINNLGGWQAFCRRSETEDLDTFARAAFLKAYEAFTRTGVGEEQSQPTLGEKDQQNLTNGFQASKPVMISTKTTPRLPEPKREEARISLTRARAGLNPFQ